MDEASKTKQIWTDFEWSLLRGEGIDIGAGPDPVTPTVQRFDIEHGDANTITCHVKRQFDFVFSSHCLEHMHDPRSALKEWWQLVRPEGVLFFMVPDEDLYEQGVFPSRFNGDHKATFTISKRASWSPVSHNVLDLCRSLNGGEIVSIELHDIGYDRSMLMFGNRPVDAPSFRKRTAHKLCRLLGGNRVWRSGSLSKMFYAPTVVDQTLTGALAQIQAIVRKR